MRRLESLKEGHRSYVRVLRWLLGDLRLANSNPLWKTRKAQKKAGKKSGKKAEKNGKKRKKTWMEESRKVKAEVWETKGEKAKRQTDIKGQGNKFVYTTYVARRIVSARREKALPTDGPTDGRTHPLIELRARN